MSSTRLPAISTTAVTIHPVPMDGTDGKVANEPSRVRVSVVEPSGTWTFGLGKKRDLRLSIKNKYRHASNLYFITRIPRRITTEIPITVKLIRQSVNRHASRHK